MLLFCSWKNEQLHNDKRINEDLCPLGGWNYDLCIFLLSCHLPQVIEEAPCHLYRGWHGLGEKQRGNDGYSE